MSTVLNFRRFVNDRLAAAAREIFGVFEETVAELEKELERQQRAAPGETGLLRNPADVQQLLVNPDQGRCGQKDLNYRPDPVKDDCPRRREAAQKFPFDIVVVKIGDDGGAKLPAVVAPEEGQHQSSSLHQKPGELYASQACEAPEPTSNLNGDSPLHMGYVTDDSKDWMEMQPLDSVDKSLACFGCGRRFPFQEALDEHRKSCSGKDLSCSLCGECFTTREDLSAHMSCHMNEKSNSSEPCLSFSGSSQSYSVRKKRFCCTECGKWFTQVGVLNRHKRIHTGETPYSCSECGRRFRRKDEMLRHQRNHKERHQVATQQTLLKQE